MKTLEEFIQRLRNDPAFEKQAQAFDRGDDLIAFVKREGYDFTLEQLMREFESERQGRAETVNTVPAPVEVSASPPTGPEPAEFPMKPEVFSSGENRFSLPESGNHDFTREQPLEKLPQPKDATPPPEPEEEPKATLFRSGGGRHRGFSLQRLKSISEEDA